MQGCFSHEKRSPDDHILSMRNAAHMLLRLILSKTNDCKTSPLQEKANIFIKNDELFRILQSDMRAKKLVTNFAIKEHLEVILNSRMNDTPKTSKAFNSTVA